MASRLKRMIKAFGWADAFSMYVRVKIKPSGVLFSKRYNTRFYLRPHTSDYYTFDQVFIKDQYKINLTFIPKTIIDAGANIGLSAVYFAHRFPQAMIVAVEPDRKNFEMLKKNTQNFTQIQSLCKGIWSRDTSLKIINAHSVQNAFMVAETTVDDKHAIPAVSIQSIIAQNEWQTIDILKIDIEGSEKEMFEKNYEQWLPKTKVIFIELHDWMKKGCSKAVFTAISQYNFSFEMQDENLIFINDDLVSSKMS